MPGVRVLGVEVAGLDRADAAAVRPGRAAVDACRSRVRVGEETVRVRAEALHARRPRDRRRGARRGPRLWTAPRALLSPLDRRDRSDVAPVLRRAPGGAAHLLNALLAAVRAPAGRAPRASRCTAPSPAWHRRGRARRRRRRAARVTSTARRLDGGAGRRRRSARRSRADSTAARRASGRATRGSSSRRRCTLLTYDGRPLGTLAPDGLARLLGFERRAGDFLVARRRGRGSRASLDPALAPWRAARRSTRASRSSASSVRVVPAGRARRSTTTPPWSR